MGKHAYLIMAHHRPDLLRELLSAIDDKRNDIFIHIDKKSDINVFDFYVNHSRLILVNRINVNWGGYSQVKCEFELFRSAYSNGPYDYYHLLTGATFPLYGQDFIHKFFDENCGKEFIGFSKDDYSFRVKYYFAFNETGKETNKIKKILYKIRILLLKAQRKTGFSILDFYPQLRNITVKKGLAYASVTESFTAYMLSKESLARTLLRNSFLGDEILLQTLAYNSEFKSALYDTSNEYNGCKRAAAWDDLVGPRDAQNFISEDLNFLIESGLLFALKFEGPDGIELIKAIRAIRGF